MKRIALPAIPLVTAEATARLQLKFTAAKARAEEERFWRGVQARKQPQKPVDWSELAYWDVPF